jgi:hypothetical protein
MMFSDMCTRIQSLIHVKDNRQLANEAENQVGCMEKSQANGIESIQCMNKKNIFFFNRIRSSSLAESDGDYYFQIFLSASQSSKDREVGG